jgi:hypothetical protein
MRQTEVMMPQSVRVLAIAGFLAAAALALSACSAHPAPDPTRSPGSSAAASGDPVGSATPSPTSDAAEPATDAFLAWLAASREPDADAACAALAPELAARMISELNQGGAVHVESCEAMITATADLYRAVGQDAEADVDVQQESPTDATLFVTYLATGDCGTVVMHRTGGTWILTEQTRECAR